MIIYPNTGLLWGASLLKTGLLNAEFHLFKAGEGIILSSALTLAELVAAEADYTGYADIVPTWADPLLNPVGGAGTDSGLAQFAPAAPYTVGNVIGGGWVQTAGGILVAAWDYEAPGRVMAGPGDGIPVDLIMLFG